MNFSRRPTSTWSQLLLTFIFVLFFATLVPQPAFSDVPIPTDGEKSLLVGCVILAIGVVITVSLYKLCQKIPAVNPPPKPPVPPPTNPPPRINPTNTNRVVKKTLTAAVNTFQFMSTPDTLSKVAMWNIIDRGWVDSIQSGMYTSICYFSLQSTKTLTSNAWKDALNFTWYDSSSGGAYLAVYKNNSNIYNAYYTKPLSVDNYVPVEFTDGEEREEFFRLTAPSPY